MHSRKRLRTLIEQDEAAYMAGVHDALSAALVRDRTGVDGIQHSGYGTAASRLGYPDLDFTTLSETTDTVRNMVRVADGTPVVVDGDTGFGSVVHLSRSIADIEATGAAGIFIEDQATPKKCGLMEGKELISAAEMTGKIEAALHVRSDEDFVVMARTDAYGEDGVEEVIRRGEAYAKAGAEVFLIGEVLPVADIATITDAIDIPVYTLTAYTEAEGFDPWQSIQAHDEAGAALVSDVAGLLQASFAAMRAYLDEVAETGHSDREMTPLDSLTDYLDAREYEQFATRHQRDSPD